jgi:hemoglobin
MTDIKHDINTREDISRLIINFYDNVKKDRQLADHFTHVDWEHHTPIIIDFWCMILLGDPTYRGNPLSKHLHMPLQQQDFEQWLFHFKNAVDGNFTGPKAEEAKQRAITIASMFQYKMGLLH